jgi:protein required for attachment to host cells
VSEDGVTPFPLKIDFSVSVEASRRHDATREGFDAEILQRIVAEIPKELTSHPVLEIERLIAA